MAGRVGVLSHSRIYETQAPYGQRIWLCAEPGTRNQLKSFWVMAPFIKLTLHALYARCPGRPTGYSREITPPGRGLPAAGIGMG